jgi:hypothetical protein
MSPQEPPATSKIPPPKRWVLVTDLRDVASLEVMNCIAISVHTTLRRVHTSAWYNRSREVAHTGARLVGTFPSRSLAEAFRVGSLSHTHCWELAMHALAGSLLAFYVRTLACPGKSPTCAFYSSGKPFNVRSPLHSWASTHPVPFGRPVARAAKPSVRSARGGKRSSRRVRHCAFCVYVVFRADSIAAACSVPGGARRPGSPRSVCPVTFGGDTAAKATPSHAYV